MKKVNWMNVKETVAWGTLGLMALGLLVWTNASGGCPFASCGTGTVPAKTAAQSAKAAPEVTQDVWMTDFNAAKALAKKENKILFMLFSGSDWCHWCIKLDGEVLTKPEFLKWAKTNAVLFHADFPRGKQLSESVKQQNTALAQQYGVRGFPTVILAQPDGKVIARTGYEQGGAAAYVKHLDNIRK